MPGTDRGATAVEYALLVGLVALMVTAGVSVLGLLASGHLGAGAHLFD